MNATTALRVVVVLVASASIALAGAANVHAADPTATPSAPMIGGDLNAYANGTVGITSHSSMPVVVTTTPNGPFTLDPATFTLDPEETMTMRVIGDGRGTVTALMRSTVVVEGDTASVQLEVGFPKPAPPEFPWPVVVAFAVVALVLLSGFYVARRVARSFTIVRKEP